MLHPLALPTLTWPLWVNNLGYREIRLGCLRPTGCVYTYVVRRVRLCTIQPRVCFYENLKQSLSREANSESSREVIISWARLSLHTAHERSDRQNHLFAVFCTWCFILLCLEGLWWITTKLDATTVVAVVAISLYFCQDSRTRYYRNSKFTSSIEYSPSFLFFL